MLAIAACSPPTRSPASDLAEPTSSAWVLAVDKPGAYWLGEDWFRDLGIDPTQVPDQVQIHRGEVPVPHLWLEGPKGAGLLFSAAHAPSRYASWTAYRLTFSQGQGTPMESAPMGSPAAANGQESAWFTEWQEQDRVYRPQIAAPLPWLWEQIPAPGHFSGKVELPAAASGPITVTARLWTRGGASDEASAPRIEWDGQQIGSWQQDGPEEQSWPATLASDQAGTHEFGLERKAPESGSPQQVWLDGWGVTYRQPLTLQGGALEWTAEAAGASIAGADGARLLDVTDPLSPRDLGPVESALIATEPGHDYWLGYPWLAPAPTQVRALAPVDRAGLDEAEYLIIAPETFWPALEPLAQRRREQGLAVITVTPAQVYGAFGDHRPDPEAIRSMVVQLHDQGRLRYLLLVGDAPTQPDGLGPEDRGEWIPSAFVPTAYLHETPSDLSLVADDSGQPLVALGRFPAHSVDEVKSIVDKTIEWEQETAVSTAVLTDDQAEFARFADDALPPPAEPSLRLDVAQEDARDRVLAELDKRPLWLNYAGHGSLSGWGDEMVLRREDRWSQPALVTVWACLSAYFVHPDEDSLAEVWLRAPRGGAVAFVGPTGGTDVQQQQVLARAFYADIEAGSTLGDALLSAWVAGGGATRDAARGYLLLGDPALRFPPP